jgi:hypothetical protein
MPDGYEFDIFLSFPRAGTAFEWVRNHFHPVLRDTLTDELGIEPKIFVFTKQATGVNWQANIVGSLRRSRCLVAVWGPPYFRSAWCMAEWESIRQREQLFGLGTEQAPRGLIYPIIYHRGVPYPQEALAIYAGDIADLSDWVNPMPGFRDTERYPLFYDVMRPVAAELAELLPQAPAWQPDWPVVTPDPGDSKPVPSVQPRL